MRSSEMFVDPASRATSNRVADLRRSCGRGASSRARRRRSSGAEREAIDAGARHAAAASAVTSSGLASSVTSAPARWSRSADDRREASRSPGRRAGRRAAAEVERVECPGLAVTLLELESAARPGTRRPASRPHGDREIAVRAAPGAERDVDVEVSRAQSIYGRTARRLDSTGARAISSDWSFSAVHRSPGERPTRSSRSLRLSASPAFRASRVSRTLTRRALGRVDMTRIDSYTCCRGHRRAEVARGTVPRSPRRPRQD